MDGVKALYKFLLFDNDIPTFLTWLTESSFTYNHIHEFTILQIIDNPAFELDSILTNYDVVFSIKERYIISNIAIIIPLSVNAATLLKLRLSFCEYIINTGFHVGKM